MRTFGRKRPRIAKTEGRAAHSTACGKCNQAAFRAYMLPRQFLETLVLTMAAVLFTALAGPLAHAQGAKEVAPRQGQETFREAVPSQHRTKSELVGSLVLYSPSHMLTSYLIEVTNARSPDGPPREIRITERTGRHSVLLFDKPEQEMFLYMFPLDVDEKLLVTVWSSAITRTVQIFYISGGRVRLVMDNTSINDVPEFIRGNIGMGGLVLLGQGRHLLGDKVLPAREQIWQWSGTEVKFILRATVPYGQRWAKVQDVLEAAHP